MKRLLFLLLSLTFLTHASGQEFNNLPVTTQKPPLHGRHWMAVTGKPLAATAGAMVFNKGGNAVDASCAMLAATCTMWDVLSCEQVIRVLKERRRASLGPASTLGRAVMRRMGADAGV